MSLLISAVGTCIGNLLVFSAIPFAWWLFRHRKEETFFRWVGIRKPQIKVKWQRMPGRCQTLGAMDIYTSKWQKGSVFYS